MTAREDALVEIAALMRQNALTIDDIANALKTGLKEEKSSGILTKIFGYIGGIFIFSGLAVFIGMHWDEIGAVGRIMLTLGVGYAVFMMAVAVAKDGRFTRAATPLFITATLLQPGGIIVALKEFSRGGDPAHGLMFMNFVMLAQCGLTFIALRRTFLAFASIFFGTSLFIIGCDLLGVDRQLATLVIGLSLTAIAWTLGNSPHRAIAGIMYFAGGVAVLEPLWDWLRGSNAEILFLGIACGVIFISTLARSRALLTLGTLSTIGYIGYFTEKHFAHNGAWPFILMFMGLVMIGMSVVAVKINKKYIAGK